MTRRQLENPAWQAWLAKRIGFRETAFEVMRETLDTIQQTGETVLIEIRRPESDWVKPERLAIPAGPPQDDSTDSEGE